MQVTPIKDFFCSRLAMTISIAKRLTGCAALIVWRYVVWVAQQKPMHEGRLHGNAVTPDHGSWIPNSELLVNLTRNYSGFIFNLSICSGTCVTWIQNQKPTFSPPLSSTGVAPALGEARRGRGRPHCLEPERLGKRDDALNGSGGGHFIPEKNKGCLCGVNIQKTMEHYHF